MDMESRPSATEHQASATANGIAALIQGVQAVQINGGNFNVASVQNQSSSSPEVHIPFALHRIPNLRDVHAATLGRATPNTGLWIYAWKEYCIWLNPDGYIRIMWGTGMPGAGKTILTSLIINSVESCRLTSTAPICVGFVYVQHTIHSKPTVRSFLKILVKQTIERHPICLPIFNDFHDRHMRENTEPSEDEFMHILHRFNELMAATYYFIEALDEAPTEIQFDLVKTLASLDAKLFITSRPLKALEACFPEAFCFTIFAQDCDLDLHIDKEVSRSAELSSLLHQADEAWQSMVRLSIKEKCAGMFLHASLHLDSLRGCASVHDVERTLAEFPPRIEDVYHQTWERILHQDRRQVSIAKRALLWVLHASRSLTIDELRYAVATCPQSRRFDSSRLVSGNSIITFCRGLLDIEKHTNIVRLVHSTAQDALEALIHPTFPHPHSVLSAVCMNRLATCGFQNSPFQSEDELEVGLRSEPLLRYAYEFWLTHAKKVRRELPGSTLLEDFVRGCIAFPITFCFANSGPLFDVLGPLHLAAYFDLPLSYAGYINSEDPNPRTRFLGATPVCVTPWANSGRTLTELLALSPILVNSVDRYGNTALIWASKIGRVDIVRSLLAHPKLMVNQVDREGRSALIWASRHGHKYTVKILLTHPRINVNLADFTGMTALIRASLLDHADVVRLLLSRREIKVNQSEVMAGSTALIQASEQGSEHVVKLLLQHPKIDVNIADREGKTALIRAICTTSLLGLLDDERAAVVQLLLNDPRIEVNRVDKVGRSAQQWAVLEGRLDIVEVLLEHSKARLEAGESDCAGGFSKAVKGISRRAFPFVKKGR